MSSPTCRKGVPQLPQSKSTPRQGNGPTQLRPRFTRVKTGCLTCRRRKKKCDESKPACLGCRRNHEHCEWPMGDALDLGSEPDKLPTLVVCKGQPSRPEENLIRPSLGSAIGLTRACGLTTHSSLLLDHYLHHTGRLLAIVPAQKSPFLTHLVPLANADASIMHSMLAVSGTHLTCMGDSDGCIQAATLQHYMAAVRGLRSQLNDSSADEVSKMLQSLLVSILLCHYEVISGDTKGILYYHLRASRELIHSLLARQSLAGNSTMDNTSLGFCLELYAYILITNSFKPHGLGPVCTVDYDPFVMCLGELGAYTTFGTMFGSNSGLFQLIPRVTLFAAQRLREEQDGLLLPSEASCTMHSQLAEEIDKWQLQNLHVDDAIDDEGARTTAETMRSALRIYLATAFAGSLVSDPEILNMIQFHINAVMSTASMVVQSRFAAILLWPVLMAGSCMTNAAQQTYLISTLKATRYRMKHVYAVCEVLAKMWATDSPYAYGPYGLLLMERKGFSFPML